MDPIRIILGSMSALLLGALWHVISESNVVEHRLEVLEEVVEEHKNMFAHAGADKQLALIRQIIENKPRNNGSEPEL